MNSTRRQNLTAPMIGILADFNRSPRTSRGEIADRDGFVLRGFDAVSHFDGRSFNALLARGFLDVLIRCSCGHPCSCDNNGFHITAAGRAYLATL